LRIRYTPDRRSTDAQRIRSAFETPEQRFRETSPPGGKQFAKAGRWVRRTTPSPASDRLQCVPVGAAWCCKEVAKALFFQRWKTNQKATQCSAFR
jgi:hypothetical protein